MYMYYSVHVIKLSLGTLHTCSTIVQVQVGLFFVAVAVAVLQLQSCSCSGLQSAGPPGGLVPRSPEYKFYKKK